MELNIRDSGIARGIVRRAIVGETQSFQSFKLKIRAIVGDARMGNLKSCTRVARRVKESLGPPAFYLRAYKQKIAVGIFDRTSELGGDFHYGFVGAENGGIYVNLYHVGNASGHALQRAAERTGSADPNDWKALSLTALVALHIAYTEESPMEGRVLIPVSAKLAAVCDLAGSCVVTFLERAKLPAHKRAIMQAVLPEDSTPDQYPFEEPDVLRQIWKTLPLMNNGEPT